MKDIECIYGCKEMDGWVCGWVNSWMEREMGIGWMDGKADIGWMDGKIDDE